MPKTSRDKTQQRIIAAAGDLYAEDGFEISLTQISRKAGVTRATLRRHFRTRRALVDAVIATLFAGRWKPEWDALIADRSTPLQQRLTRFYTEYRSHTDRRSSRLWTRAGLLGVHASSGFSSKLEERVLGPVVRELRHTARVRAPDARPVSSAEIQLAQMLHGCIAFPNTRSHVFGAKLKGDPAAVIALMVRAYMPGALLEIKRLNKGQPST
jgi:AcrR family transcriptional regulator